MADAPNSSAGPPEGGPQDGPPGETLREQAARERAAARLDEQINEVDVRRDDVRLTDDGVQLTDQAQRRRGARRLNEQYSDFDVAPSDVRQTDSGVSLTEQAARERAARQLNEQTEIEVTPQDVQTTNEGFELSDSAKRAEAAQSIDRFQPDDFVVDDDTARVSEQAQREEAASEFDSETSTTVSPDELTQTDSGFKLTEAARRQEAAAKLSQETGETIQPSDVVLTDQGAELTEEARTQQAVEDVQSQTDISVESDDIALSDDGARLTDEAARSEALADNVDFDANSNDLSEDDIEKLAKEQLKEQYPDATGYSTGVQPDGQIIGTVVMQDGDLKGVYDIEVSTDDPSGTQFLYQKEGEDVFSSQSELRSLLTDNGVNEQNIRVTTFEGEPAAFVDENAFSGDTPKALDQLPQSSAISAAPATAPTLSSERKQELREQAAADVDGLDASDFQVDANLGQATVSATDEAISERNQQQREELRQQTASEFEDFSADDVVIEESGDTLQADIATEPKLVQYRQDVAAQAAVKYGSDALTDAYSDVKSDLNESQRQDVQIAISQRIGDDEPIDFESLPEVYRERVGEVAVNSSFLGADKNVVIDAGQQLQDEGALTEDQVQQYKTEVSEASTEEEAIDLVDLPDPLQSRLVEQYPNEAPEDIGQSIQFEQLQEQTSTEISQSDVTQTAAGLTLTETAQREELAADFSTELNTDVTGEDITISDGTATLDDQAIRQEFAANVSQESEVNLQADDVTLEGGQPQLSQSGRQAIRQQQRTEFEDRIVSTTPVTDSEFGAEDVAVGDDTLSLSETGQRTVAAAQFEEQSGVDVSPSDITLTDSGARLSSETRSATVAERLSNQYGVDIAASDVSLQDGEIQLSATAERTLAAEQFEDEAGIELGPDDLQREGGGFVLDDVAQIRANRANPNFEGFSEQFAAQDTETQTGFGGPNQSAREAAADALDEQLPQTPVDAEDVTIDQTADGQTATIAEDSDAANILGVQKGRAATGASLEAIEQEQVQNAAADIGGTTSQQRTAVSLNDPAVSARGTIEGTTAAQLNLVETTSSVEGDESTGTDLPTPDPDDITESIDGLGTETPGSNFQDQETVAGSTEIDITRVRSEQTDAITEANPEAVSQIESNLEDEYGVNLNRDDISLARDDGAIVGTLSDQGEETVAVQNAPFSDTPIGGLTTTGARIRQWELDQTDPFAEWWREETPSGEDVGETVTNNVPYAEETLEVGNDIEREIDRRLAEPRARAQAALNSARGAAVSTTFQAGNTAANLYTGEQNTTNDVAAVASVDQESNSTVENGDGIEAAAAAAGVTGVGTGAAAGTSAGIGAAAAGAGVGAAAVGAGAVAAGYLEGNVERDFVRVNAQTSPDIRSPSEQSQSELEVGDPTQSRNEIPVNTPRVESELDVTDSPTPPSELEITNQVFASELEATPQQQTDPRTIQTTQTTVGQQRERQRERQREEPTTIPGEEILDREDVRQPENDRYRQIREEFERRREQAREGVGDTTREFPTGEQSVLGRATETTDPLEEIQRRQQAAQQQRVTQSQSTTPVEDIGAATDPRLDPQTTPTIDSRTEPRQEVNQRPQQLPQQRFEQQQVQRPRIARPNVQTPTEELIQDQQEVEERAQYQAQTENQFRRRRRPRPDFDFDSEDTSDEFRDPLIGQSFQNPIATPSDVLF